jgi:tRNA(fMet)-specific endonuclease VapC
MRYLVETDVAIDWLNGHPRAEPLRPLLFGGAGERLGLSAMSYGEIYEGIYYGRDARRAQQGFFRFLRLVEVLPLTRLILRRFARIRGDLRNRGLLIGDADTLIAATALQHGLTLVTQNQRHFGRVPGLQTYYP